MANKKKVVDDEQAVRDAHFFEDGVDADGNGGVAPEAESSESEE